MKLNFLNSRKKYKLFLITMFFLVFGITQAQNQEISGKVTADGQPLPGVTVLINGTNTGTTTDFDGDYQINAKTNDILVYSYIGFKTQSIIVKSNATLNVVLEEDLSELDEVVVVGYGTQKKKEVTGAVASVAAESITKTATADLATALQGKVAGVNIQASNGSPGEASNIQIRGLGSLSSGALGPLYVVDGIPYEDNPNIAPEQIESIDILKDGASASVYGTRASNGVILITTKKGKVGKMQISLNMYTGVQNITSGTPLMNTTQQIYQIDRRNELNNSNFDPFNSNPSAAEYNSDFVGDIQNDNAIIRNTSVNISGGIDNLRLNYNSTYFNQDGVLISSGFKRFSNRFTGQYTKGKFKIFASMGITTENREQEPFNIYERAVQQQPYGRPLNEIETVGSSGLEIEGDGDGIIGLFASLFDIVRETETKRDNIAINLNYEILDGLNFKVNLGKNSFNSFQKVFNPQFLSYRPDGTVNASGSVLNAKLQETYLSSGRETLETILNYKTNFGKHNVDFLGVLSYEKFQSKTHSTGVIYDRNALNNDIQTLSGGAEGIKPVGINIENTLSGKLFRVQYNYDEKYLLSASIRRDGSSRFAEENRYGDFYGVSVGWNIHEENFLKDIHFLNTFKLRGSFAEVGNQSTRAYAFDAFVESGVNYPFGPTENLGFGYIQRRIFNRDLKWETTISKNFGIDLAFFRNKLTVNADYYYNDKKDMLLLQANPGSAGTSQPNAINEYGVIATNAGNMVNKGLEIAASYKDKIGEDINYTLSGTFTKNKNVITSLNGVERGYGSGIPFTNGGESADFTTYLAEGYEAGAFFLLQNDGVIKTTEELTAYQQIVPGASLGDIRYVNQNNDNKIDEQDLVYSGSGQPEWEAGLNLNIEYKGFDFYAQTYASIGAEVYNGSKLYAYRTRRHLDLYSMWTPQNPTSDIPTERGLSSENVRSRSDYFLEDGSYFRIRTLTLGYTIPGIADTGIEKARVYLTSVNPFTFTNYSGYDPEVGGDGLLTRGVDKGNYPITRQFMLGFQLNF